MRPGPRVAAEASGAILEVPVRSRVIAPVRPTAVAARTAPLRPTVATPAEAAACPVIAPAHRTAAGTAPLRPIAPLLLTVATSAAAAACPVTAPAHRTAAAGIAPLLPREGAMAVVAAVPAAAEAPTAGAASTPGGHCSPLGSTRVAETEPISGGCRSRGSAEVLGWAAITLRCERGPVRPYSGPARSEPRPFR
jgi:hypothetical protein